MGDELLMPYIPPERRKELDLKFNPKTAGELNYVLTTQLVNYVFLHGESYQSYNDIMGALEGAKLEIYRRQIAQYEDVKARENGDVY